MNALYHSSESSIGERLLALRDEPYAAFMRKLVPNLEPAHITGVRAAHIAGLAKALVKNEPEAARAFLASLAHATLEENLLHASLLGRLPLECGVLLEAVEAFLPYVDNWAVCDALPPKAFAKSLDAIALRIPAWLSSAHPYTVRFGLVTLLTFFLGDARFDPAMLRAAAALPTGDYYVNMAAAWYVSCALVEQYDATLPLLESRAFGRWVHNKAIQKAVESFRISPERKAHLKTLRRKTKEN